VVIFLNQYTCVAIISVSILEEWESAKRSVFSNNFNTDTIGDDLSFLLESVEVGLNYLSETEFS